jgi:hypothetical protein
MANRGLHERWCSPGTASEREPCCNGALCHRHSGVSIMFELANDVSARPERSRSTAPVEGMPLAPYLPYQQKRSYQGNSDDLEIWHRSRIDKSLGARTARCRGGGRRRWCGRRGRRRCGRWGRWRNWRRGWRDVRRRVWHRGRRCSLGSAKRPEWRALDRHQRQLGREGRSPGNGPERHSQLLRWPDSDVVRTALLGHLGKKGSSLGRGLAPSWGLIGS